MPLAAQYFAVDVHTDIAPGGFDILYVSLQLADLSGAVNMTSV
jgi:hypothetical protein